MMFCNKCGSEITTEDLFCKVCGQKQQDYDEQKNKEIVSENDKRYKATKVQSSSKKKRLIVVLSAIVILIALVAVGIFTWFFIGNKAPDEDYRLMNLASKASDITFNEEYVYYLYSELGESAVNLNAINIKTNEKSVISDEFSAADDIFCFNQKIYYIKDNDENTSSLGVMDTDGKNDKTLIMKDIGNDIYFDSLIVHNNKLFYIYNNNLYSSNLDGRNENLVLDTIQNYYIFDNDIFYNDNKGLKIKHLKTGNIVSLNLDDGWAYTVYKGYLYYINQDDNSICRINLKEETKSVLSGDYKCADYTIYNEKIYFTSMFSDDERSYLCETASNSYDTNSSEYLLTQMTITFTGYLTQMSLDGSEIEDYLNEDGEKTVSSLLYLTPEGVYSKTTYFQECEKLF